MCACLCFGACVYRHRGQGHLCISHMRKRKRNNKPSSHLSPPAEQSDQVLRFSAFQGRVTVNKSGTRAVLEGEERGSRRQREAAGGKCVRPFQISGSPAPRRNLTGSLVRTDLGEHLLKRFCLLTVGSRCVHYLHPNGPPSL